MVFPKVQSRQEVQIREDLVQGIKEVSLCLVRWIVDEDRDVTALSAIVHTQPYAVWTYKPHLQN